MNDTLYPIGTAIKLLGSDVPYIIVGYYAVDSKEIVHKYVAVNGIFGFGKVQSTVLLDDNLVEEVLSLGYSDSEGDSMRRSIAMFANAIISASSEQDENDENE